MRSAPIDYPTLFRASAFVGAALLGFLALQARKTYPGFVRIVVGIDLLAAGIVAADLRGFGSDAFWAIQITVVLTFALIDNGIRLFCATEKRGRWPYLYVLAAILLLTFLFFTEPLYIRELLTSLLLIPIFVDTSLALLGEPPKGCRFGYRFTAAVFTVFWISACVRIVAIFHLRDRASPYFSAHPVNTLYFFLVMFQLLALPFGIITLVHERLVAESEKESEERLRAERELVQAERLAQVQFKSLFEQSSIFAGILDLDGTVREVNQEPLKVCGYGREQVIGVPFWQTPWWRSSKSVQEKLRMAVTLAASGQTYRDVLPYVYADGSAHVAEFGIRPIRDESGNITFLHPAGIDVTERIRAVQALRRAEERSRLISERLSLALEASQCGTFEWNFKNNLHYWDPMLEKLYGFEPGTFPGTYEDWLACIYTPDVPRAEEASRATLKEGFNWTRFRVRRRNDGQVRWMLSNAKVHFDREGKPERMIGINVDITEQMQAEEKIRLSEQRYHSLVRASSQLVWVCDADGYYLVDADDWQRFTGQTSQEARGLGWLNVLNPEDRDRTLKAWQQAVQTKSTFTAEYWLRRNDGAYRAMRVSAIPVLDSVGKVTEWVGMNTDVTEQKLAEERLRRNEKLAAAGRLALNISHEINNPLEAVTNLLYLIGSDPGLSETTRKLAGEADRELKRVSQAVSRSLQFANPPSPPDEVNLQELTDSVTEFFRTPFERDNISIVRDFRTKNRFRRFPRDLQIVITNLLSNAHDAMRNGGKLTLRIHDAHSWKDPGVQGLRLTLADTGTGIPRELKRKVFEPFFTTKEETGAGLGLWMCCEIMRKYEGGITFRTSTAPGHSGTVFSLFFPFRRSPAARGELMRRAA
jgi:PAS domain S-box-containing protein